MDKELREILKEDASRGKVLDGTYDPISGKNAPGKRFHCLINGDDAWLPATMRKIPLVKALSGSSFAKVARAGNTTASYVAETFIKLRIRHDFTYWAYRYTVIKSKAGGDDIPFLLNAPQRKTLEELEKMRLSSTPIRMIILKARQWGGSTLVQIYMAWIQLVHKKGFYSAIVAHVNSSSLKIRAMYAKIIRQYPPSLLGLPDTAPLELKPYEGSRSDVVIGQGGKTARDNVICVGTMQSPDNIRGGDIALAHFSEVGLWKETMGKSPSDVIRSVSSSVLYKPYTMDVMESTADGENTLFHKEWLAAVNRQSRRVPVFIPWFDIPEYRLPCPDKRALAKSLLDGRGASEAKSIREEPGKYLWWLWKKGASLDGIEWYINKRTEFTDHASMAAEFPSDDIEAFANSGHKVFDRYSVEELRATCRVPIGVGEVLGKMEDTPEALKALRFMPQKEGCLKIWEFPDNSMRVDNRYVVSVDVGGRSSSADFSVISVIDRWWRREGEGDVIVAQWRGHCRHDLLAWKMAQIAQYYCHALLVVESNTFETKDNDTEGEHAEYILDQIAMQYDNLYAREASKDSIRQGNATRWGFHTNVSTKSMVIDNLVRLIEDASYVEREELALAEYNTYNREGTKFNAAEGFHDDIVMSRAIGLYVSSTLPMPAETKALDIDYKPINIHTI